VPSATVLDYLRSRPRTRAAERLFAIGAPGPPGRPLPQAAEEIRSIARLLNAPDAAIRLGADAAERAVKAQDVGRYQILHFATHAVVDHFVPRRSAVLLAAGASEDGLLQVNEIANLALNADLVVLAACRSQEGRWVRGEGLLSLSRAFMHAGTRAVAATLWDVGDRDTRKLMELFYAGLAGGVAPDEALRVAQLQMMRAGGTYARPAVWAPFVISGDARTPL
jgi:CHAT domain-containing protein